MNEPTLYVSIAISASGDQIILAGQSQQAIEIYYLELQNTSASAATVILKDGANPINGGGFWLAAHGSYVFDPPVADAAQERRYLRLGKGNAFVINVGAALNHNGFLIYRLR